MDSKRCSGCGVWKTLDYFHKHKRCRGGVTTVCKECTLERCKKRQSTEKYKTKRSEYDRVRRYNLSTEEYNLLVLKQQDKCGLCEVSDNNGRSWCIDHSHSDNRVRGLLCTHCNLLLGHAKDNKETLRKAILWLEANEYE